MRAVLYLLAAALLVAAPGVASAQVTAAPAPASNGAPAMQANPAVASPASAAAAVAPVAGGSVQNGQKMVCQYTTHDGMLIPLNHCETQSEADKRRRDRQQNLREFQLNALVFPGHRP